MKMTIRLDENDLKQAISDFLNKQGYSVNETIFHYYKGLDSRESSYVYAEAKVESGEKNE